MSKQLTLDPNFRVELPFGATGAKGEYEWEDSYLDGKRLTGSTGPLEVVIPDPARPQQGKIVFPGGDPFGFLGAASGSKEPPYLTIRLYPIFPDATGLMGRGDPIVRRGRPHEHPPGSGYWDLEDIGGENRPVLLDRETAAGLVTRADNALTEGEQQRQITRQQQEAVTGALEQVDTGLAQVAQKTTVMQQQVQQAMAEAMKLGLPDPRFVSPTNTNPRPPTWQEYLDDGRPDYYWGSRMTGDLKAVQLLRYKPDDPHAVWEPVGEPAATQGQVETVRRSVSHVSRATLEATLDIDPQMFDGDRWLLRELTELAIAHADNIMTVTAARANKVWRRENDVVHMRYFYGPGTTEFTTAWADAVEYANERGGLVTFQVSDEKRFDIYNGEAIPDITAPRVGWRGLGPSTVLNFYGGAALKWQGKDEGNMVLGGGLADMTVAYLSPSSEESARVARLIHTSGQRFTGLLLDQVRTLISAGGGYEGFLDENGQQAYRNVGEAFDILAQVSGSFRNAPRNLFDLRSGFGFTLNAHSLFLAGVLAPKNWQEAITTIEGATVIGLTEGRWDTVEVNAGLFERFSHLIHAIGRYQLPKLNIRVNGTRSDYNADQAFLFETTEYGILANIELLNMPYATSRRSHALETRGAGAIYNLVLDKFKPHLVADSGAVLNGKIRRLTMTDATIFRTGAMSKAPALVIGPDVQYAKFSGQVNPPIPNDGTDELPIGDPEKRSTVGVAVAYGADHYQMDMQVYGQLPYLFDPAPANAAPLSADRSVRGNIAVAQPTYPLPAMIASGATWTNPSPFVLALSIIGGTTVAVRRNDVPVAAGGEIMVRPGDVLKISYDTSAAKPDWAAAVVP